MLPDWFAKAVMSGSFAAVRIICHIAENGEESFGPDGRRVITACLTYRELQSACGFSNRRSIASGIAYAVKAGWLIAQRPVHPRAPSRYLVPLSLSGSLTEPHPYPQPSVGPMTGSISEPISGSSGEPYCGSKSEPQTTSRRSPTALSGSLGEPCRGSESEPLYDDKGRGGNDDDIHPEYRDIDNHHHNLELVQKLNRYGFSDAASFVKRHSPDRIEAAIKFIKTLKGVRNRGALIRRTVERPGEIPRPPAPEELYYDGPFGHLVAR